MNTQIKAFILFLSFSTLFCMDEPELPSVLDFKKSLPLNELVNTHGYSIRHFRTTFITTAEYIYIGNKVVSKTCQPKRTSDSELTIVLYDENKKEVIEERFNKDLTINEIIEHIKQLDEQYGEKLTTQVTSQPTIPSEKTENKAAEPIIDDSFEQQHVDPEANQKELSDISRQAQEKDLKQDSNIGLCGQYSFCGIPLKVWTYSAGAAVAAGACYLAYRLYKNKKKNKPKPIVIISNGSLPA